MELKVLYRLALHSLVTQLGGLKVSGVPQRFSWTDNGKDYLHRLVLVPRYPHDKVSFGV